MMICGLHASKKNAAGESGATYCQNLTYISYLKLPSLEKLSWYVLYLNDFMFHGGGCSKPSSPI